MKKFIYLILSILSFSLVIILSTEIYLKYIGLGDPIVYDSNYVYGYAPKADQKKVRLKGSIVTINDVGLRSVYNWSDKLKYKKIIFFGDSVTYGGSYIDDKKTFVFLACDDLEKFNIVCGNAGVNSYGIHNIIYRSKFDKRIKDTYLKIFVIVPDDFYRGLQKSGTAHFYLNEKKFILPGIFEALNFVATKYDLNNYIGKLDDTKIDKNKYDLINQTIELVNREFNILNSKKENFISFYIHPKKKTKISHYILKELSKNNEIYDLGKHLKDEHYYDSIHLNKKGHEEISEIINYSIKNFIQMN